MAASGSISAPTGVDRRNLATFADDDPCGSRSRGSIGRRVKLLNLIREKFVARVDKYVYDQEPPVDRYIRVSSHPAIRLVRSLHPSWQQQLTSWRLEEAVTFYMESGDQSTSKALAEPRQSSNVGPLTDIAAAFKTQTSAEQQFVALLYVDLSCGDESLELEFPHKLHNLVEVAAGPTLCGAGHKCVQMCCS
ncbi:hypothetical protein PRNP1_010346 [Phytophthora ramorum]